MEPITPIRPKPGKSRLQPRPQVQPTTPTAPTLFASLHINSQNQRAARVLFTPRSKHPSHALAQQQPSPTPQSAELPAHPALSFPSTSHHTSSESSDSSESEMEKSLETALAALNVHSQSSSGSSSSRAGPHSIPPGPPPKENFGTTWRC